MDSILHLKVKKIPIFDIQGLELRLLYKTKIILVSLGHTPIAQWTTISQNFEPVNYFGFGVGSGVGSTLSHKRFWRIL